MRSLPASLALLVAVLAAAPAVGQKPSSSAFPEPTPAERVRLTELLDIVRRADRVVALPVVAAGPPLSLATAVAEKPVKVDPAIGRSLGRRLARYDWGRMSVKACGFQPGVAFRFYQGDRSTQVQICFTCGEMALDGLEGSLGNKKMLDEADLEAWRRAAQKAFPAEDFRSLP